MPHEKQTYFDNVVKANEEMKQDVEALIQNNPGAIIIIAGDHGPYHTKNCTDLPNISGYDSKNTDRWDIQDRYGAFLAIRWPEGFKKDYPIQTNQDVLPAVFSNLFEDERIWEQGRTSTQTVGTAAGNGIYVKGGIIHGGVHDGEPLFIGLDKTEFAKIDETR